VTLMKSKIGIRYLNLGYHFLNFSEKRTIVPFPITANLRGNQS